MEKRVDSPFEPASDDESTIWRFIYNKKIEEKSRDPIDAKFFKELCDEEKVKFGPDEACKYFFNIMRCDLYKERELAPHEILELYRVLKIELSPYQVETLERNFSVFLKLNSQRHLASWSLPRQEAAKRAYEPLKTDDTEEDDVRPKKKRRSLKQERQESETRCGEGCSRTSEHREILDLSEAIKMESEDNNVEEVNPEDVKVLKEVAKPWEDSDDEGDVTIEKVISGDADVPEDIEEKMWDYVGTNFEKDRPKRLKTVGFWSIFITETISDNDTLTALQLLNHFIKKLLPKLWNHPIRIATRLRILRGLQMPITKDQKKSLEKEFKLKIQVNQLSCIEEWEPRRSSEATPRKSRVYVPSDSEDDKSPPPPIEVTPKRTPRTPRYVPKTPSLPKSAHSICKKPVPDPLTGRARRAVFTPGDDESMWNFLLAEIRLGLKPEPKGLEIWKRYIEETECWREARNLNSHYRKIMTQNLHLVEIPLADKLELYMYNKIPCPSDQIREFREKYLINHRNRVITYAKERTDEGFDDDDEEEEEDEIQKELDAEEMRIEESDEEDEDPERAKAPSKGSKRKKSSKLADAPESSRTASESADNRDSRCRKSSNAPEEGLSDTFHTPEASDASESTRKQRSSKLRQSPEEARFDIVDAPESSKAAEASESRTENQGSSRIRKSSRATRKPAKLAHAPEEDLHQAIDDAEKTGNVSENLFGLVLKALGNAFENDEKLDLKKIKTTFAKKTHKILKKSGNPVFQKENKRIVQHLVDSLCESAPEDLEGAQKLLKVTCQQLIEDSMLLEQ